MTRNQIKTRIDSIVAKRITDSIAPSYAVTGEACSQCGDKAWHAQGTSFCLKHDQNTLRFSELDGLTESDRKESLRILALWVQ